MKTKIGSDEQQQPFDTTDGGPSGDLGDLGGFRSCQPQPAEQQAGKGSKQFQSVAKQFGSLSRSMGRKIKKNLMDNFSSKQAAAAAAAAANDPAGHNNGHWECPEFVLCARLHTEKHQPCLDQMAANYLQSARQRFEQQQSERQRQTLVSQRRKQHTLAEAALQVHPKVFFSLQRIRHARINSQITFVSSQQVPSLFLPAASL